MIEVFKYTWAWLQTLALKTKRWHLLAISIAFFLLFFPSFFFSKLNFIEDYFLELGHAVSEFWCYYVRPQWYKSPHNSSIHHLNSFCSVKACMWWPCLSIASGYGIRLLLMLVFFIAIWTDHLALSFWFRKTCWLSLIKAVGPKQAVFCQTWLCSTGLDKEGLASPLGTDVKHRSMARLLVSLIDW